MIKCQNCGTENPDSAKFCVKCGAKLSHNPQPSNSNFTICPNCGHKNVKNAKFCMKCGYRFNGKSNQNQSMDRPNLRETVHSQSDEAINQQPQTNQAQPQFRPQSQNQTAPDYSQQWQSANQHLNNFQEYSNNYFAWLKDTLMHPLAHHYNASPYFGIVSFLISAVLVWVSTLVGPGLGNFGDVENDLTSIIIGNSSLNVYVKNYDKALTPICMLILSIISMALFVLIAYLGYELVAAHKENIFSFTNRLAGLTNTLMPASLLLILAALIDKAEVTDVLTDIFSTIMFFGLAVIIATAHSNKLNNYMNGIYVAVIAGVVYDFVLPLFTAIVGIIMG